MDVRDLRGRRVVIATPFYNYQAYSPFVSSLAATIKLAIQLGVELDFWEMSNVTLIDRARNYLVTRFHKYTDYDDLVFIDADQSWNPAEFFKLLTYNKDLIGAGIPLKGFDDAFGVLAKIDDNGNFMIDDETGLYRAVKVPGGFMRINRRCIDIMVNAYPERKYFGGYDILSGYDYNFFDSIITDDGLKLGEDFGFCELFRKAGGEIFVDADLSMSHYWMEKHEVRLSDRIYSQTIDSNMSRSNGLRINMDTVYVPDNMEVDL